MDTKEAYAEKFMGQINQWKAEIEKFKGKAQEASGDAKINYSKEIETLEEKVAEAEGHLQKMQRAGEDTWVELRENAQKSWDELTTRFKEFPN
ncbi:MAG: coiled coil domain-containing protein [Bacteroidetes bacterium]|nr:coiled coil domain-containing protein [Bacteroidota bacterium]MCH8524097.1 hypothetical protein [Balneolales bacterium]